jgi:hypothetical protein
MNVEVGFAADLVALHLKAAFKFAVNQNNLAPRVFTPARLAVLELLASPAAISLENALCNPVPQRVGRRGAGPQTFDSSPNSVINAFLMVSIGRQSEKRGKSASQIEALKLRTTSWPESI